MLLLRSSGKRSVRGSIGKRLVAQEAWIGRREGLPRKVDLGKLRCLSSYSIDGDTRCELVPYVHPEAWVAPNASVIGNVVIGAHSSVWFNSCLRGDRDLIKIGEETNIQDGCTLHTDPGLKLMLGDRVSVGHGVNLHGCTIHSNCLVGIGATILNHAVIGPNCLIGAGALITEGKHIPEGSLVIGTNKVVRKLSEDEIEGLIKNAENYVENQRRYKTTLKMI